MKHITANELASIVKSKDKAIIVCQSSTNRIVQTRDIEDEIIDIQEIGIDTSSIQSIYIIDREDIAISFNKSWEKMETHDEYKIRELMHSKGNIVTAEAYIFRKRIWKNIEDEYIKLKKRNNTGVIVGIVGEENGDMRNVYIKNRRNKDGSVRNAIVEYGKRSHVIMTEGRDMDSIGLIETVCREMEKEYGRRMNKVIVDNCVYNIEGYCEAGDIDLKLCAMY